MSVWRIRGIDAPRLAGDHGNVVDPEAWPQTPEAALALVALVLSEILGRDQDAGDELLADFVMTAWPSARAARQ